MVPRNPHPKGSGPSSVSNIGGPRKRYLTRSIVDQLEWTLGCKGFTSIDTWCPHSGVCRARMEGILDAEEATSRKEPTSSEPDSETKEKPIPWMSA